MNNKDIDSQSNPSGLKELEHLKRQDDKTTTCTYNNRMISSAGVYANIVIVIVIIPDVNGPLLCTVKGYIKCIL